MVGGEVVLVAVIGDLPAPDQLHDQVEGRHQRHGQDDLQTAADQNQCPQFVKPPDGKFDLFATEGGTAAMAYIFNSLMVLPVSAILNPLPIPRMITQDILVSLLLASALIPIFLFREARMGRATGAIFVATYVLYMAYRTIA